MRLLAKNRELSEPVSQINSEFVEHTANLFKDFLNGNDSAAVEIFHLFNKKIYTFCCKILVNKSKAEDATQEVWERVLGLRKSKIEVYNPAGFLMKVARNLCLNKLKSDIRYTQIEEVNLEQANPEFTELEVLAIDALDQLPIKYKEVLVLNYYCGYQYSEIAEITDETPEAVWQRASRARKELRKIINKQLR